MCGHGTHNAWFAMVVCVMMFGCIRVVHAHVVPSHVCMFDLEHMMVCHALFVFIYLFLHKVKSLILYCVVSLDFELRAVLSFIRNYLCHS